MFLTAAETATAKLLVLCKLCSSFVWLHNLHIQMSRKIYGNISKTFRSRFSSLFRLYISCADSFMNLPTQICSVT